MISLAPVGLSLVGMPSRLSCSPTQSTCGVAKGQPYKDPFISRLGKESSSAPQAVRRSRAQNEKAGL
jgi:hypothetical protein